MLLSGADCTTKASVESELDQMLQEVTKAQADFDEDREEEDEEDEEQTATMTFN